ncbi:MAG: hypothetical protein PHY93_15310 [Bacteriovorax sp.]|nr:hypothetical protein [Bacteriovorax sp.]
MKTTLTLFALFGLMATAPGMVSIAKAETPTERQDLSSVSSFCRDRLAVLKAAYRQAELESQAGNTTSSARLLEKGLRDANLRINPRFANALTAKAIRRGITLLDNLKATENNRQKLRAINNFLFNYYIFIENVSNRLDIPYFSSNSGFSRISNSNLQFERLFINFAKEQVNMVLESMTTTANDGRSEVIYPIGSPDLVLTALKVTTNAMANDLSDSIFAARYACTIEALDNVSTDIARYLDGHTSYGDDFIAIQELVGATKRAVSGARECNDGQSYESAGTSRTTDALRGAIRLESGTTQQVRLNGSRYIKKLIISAEGLRNDAMFDVVVNGDVKGTVYVPGRDPSYFVTIEDNADSIELVSRGGTAIISRILVVTE